MCATIKYYDNKGWKIIMIKIKLSKQANKQTSKPEIFVI